ITFLSLVLGELVPKQLALRAAERIAVSVARPMSALARVVSPVTFLLDGASRLVLALLGPRAATGHTVTDEEIKTLIAEATRVGVVEEVEQEMISGVMRLADRPVRAIMTPRPDIEWIDVADSPDEIRRKLAEHHYSRYPVCQGLFDAVMSIVYVRDIIYDTLVGQPMILRFLI